MYVYWVTALPDFVCVDNNLLVTQTQLLTKQILSRSETSISLTELHKGKTVSGDQLNKSLNAVSDWSQIWLLPFYVWICHCVNRIYRDMITLN
jgi:hypothetical protein